MIRLTTADSNAAVYVNPLNVVMVGQAVDAKTGRPVFGQAMVMITGAQFVAIGSADAIAAQVANALSPPAIVDLAGSSLRQ